MNKKTKAFLVIGAIVSALLLSGCQTNSREFGANTTIDIPKGKRLVPSTVQWEIKGDDVWYLIEDAPESYKPKKYEFKEASNHGKFEWTITFVEH